MSGRTVSWLIGGGIALAALFLVLTTVPVAAQAVESQPIDLRATSSLVGVPGCATMRLTGQFESQRTDPLVNVWGLSQVAATIVSPTVYVGGEAPCPDDVDVALSQVVVFTPACASPAIVDADEWDDDFMTEPQSRCDGQGVMLPGLVGEGGFDATTSANTNQRFELADSGIIAADIWCLGSEFGMGYERVTEGSASAFGVTADQVQGDLCIDLS